MKNEDSFINYSFKTDKGATLVVIGTNGGKGNKKKYICHCSVCSQDEELWPNGSIFSYKGNLLKGFSPCGCGKTVFFSKEQYEVLVKRKADSLGFTFIGFAEEFRGKKTKVTINNPLTGSVWESPIYYFLKHGRDPVEVTSERRKKNTISDKDHIESFIATGSYPKGTTYKRNLEKVDTKGTYCFWDCTCPICSNDEYVKAGVCSGVFSSHTSSLKRGFRFCRCGASYKYNKAQREYQIQQICDREGLTFLGWDSPYEDCRTKMSWECSKGHVRTMAVQDFYWGTRCAICNNGAGGYYAYRSEEKDWLYLLEASWLKCGRSFDLNNRYKKILRDSGEVSVEEKAVYTGTHQQVYDTEQYIKSIMYLEGLNFYEGDGYTSVWSGSTECYTKSSLEYIKELLEESPLERLK